MCWLICFCCLNSCLNSCWACTNFPNRKKKIKVGCVAWHGTTGFARQFQNVILETSVLVILGGSFISAGLLYHFEDL